MRKKNNKIVIFAEMFVSIFVLAVFIRIKFHSFGNINMEHIDMRYYFVAHMCSVATLIKRETIQKIHIQKIKQYQPHLQHPLTISQNRLTIYKTGVQRKFFKLK